MIYNYYVCMCYYYGLLAVYMYLELDVYQFWGPQIITFGRSRTLGRFENTVKEGSCLERLGLV